MTDTQDRRPPAAAVPVNLDDKIDRTALETIRIGSDGQPVYVTYWELIELAKVMSRMGPAIGPHCRNNVGMCIWVLQQASRWNLDPYMVSRKTYVTESKKDGRLSLEYESQLIHAIIEKHAPLKERLRMRYEGTGGDVTCTVIGTIEGETELREWTSPPLKARLPTVNEHGWSAGSPLWRTKPLLQLFYDTSRDWARVYCPDVIAGLYAPEEIAETEAIHEAPPFERVANPLGDAPPAPTTETAPPHQETVLSPPETMAIPPTNSGEPRRRGRPRKTEPEPEPVIDATPLAAPPTAFAKGDLVQLNTPSPPMRISTPSPSGAVHRGDIQNGDFGEVMSGPDENDRYVVTWQTLPGYRVPVHAEKLLPAVAPAEAPEAASVEAEPLPKTAELPKAAPDEVFGQPYAKKTAAEYTIYARGWITRAVDEKWPYETASKRFINEREIRNGLGKPFEMAEWREFQQWAFTALEQLQPVIE